MTYFLKIIDRATESRLVKVADAVGKLAIFIAIMSWFAEFEARQLERENVRQAKLYRAFGILSQQTFLQVGGEIPSMALRDIVKEGVSLEAIQLTGGTYRQIDLSNINLRAAWIDEAAFLDVKFIGADLSSTVLDDIKFSGSDFTNATFEDAILRNVDFTKARGLTPTQFKNAAICPDVKLPVSFDRSAVEVSDAAAKRFYAEYTNDYWKTVMKDCINPE